MLIPSVMLTPSQRGQEVCLFVPLSLIPMLYPHSPCSSVGQLAQKHSCSVLESLIKPILVSFLVLLNARSLSWFLSNQVCAVVANDHLAGTARL